MMKTRVLADGQDMQMETSGCYCVNEAAGDQGSLVLHVFRAYTELGIS